jgi:hypothetical protein
LGRVAWKARHSACVARVMSSPAQKRVNEDMNIFNYYIMIEANNNHSK